MPRCMNCGSSGGDEGLIEFADGFYCWACNDAFEKYCDENREELAAQERYENFLAEY